jgi:hypothetical protein
MALRASVRALGVLLLALGWVNLRSAEGTPPFITDDPGTPGDGHWEINLGVGTGRSSATTLSELPLLELNYGIGDRLQLMYGVAFLTLSEEGQTARAGLGNSGVGVKWRFLDGGEDGLAMSVHPQYEFNTLASSADRGIVEHGSAFLLPVQLEKELGPVMVNLELGREFHSSGDSWFYGAAFSYPLQEKLAIGVELAGTTSTRFDHSVLILNFGLSYDVGKISSVLVALGRELHNGEEPRADVIAYLGWQLRI